MLLLTGVNCGEWREEIKGGDLEEEGEEIEEEEDEEEEAILVVFLLLELLKRFYDIV